jgi:hypothetical protein
MPFICSLIADTQRRWNGIGAVDAADVYRRKHGVLLGRDPFDTSICLGRPAMADSYRSVTQSLAHRSSLSAVQH